MKPSQTISIKLIRLYQKTLSPDHSPRRAFHPAGFCRHYPTCSEYAIAAIEQKGVIRGVGLASWRVLRCNPWAKPSIDFSHLSATKYQPRKN